MTIKLILFDLDGTLVDSKTDITRAINYAINPLGLNELNDNETIDLIGDGLSSLIEKIIGSKHLDKKSDVIERFISFYSTHLYDYTRPYTGVIDTLKSLPAYKKAVVTNKKENLSKRLLEGLRMVEYFELVLGPESSKEKKPSPAPVLKAMEIIGYGPEETLIVGDSNADIESGKKAGIRTIAVTYGYRHVQYLNNADYLINDFEELISILRRLN